MCRILPVAHPHVCCIIPDVCRIMPVTRFLVYTTCILPGHDNALSCPWTHQPPRPPLARSSSDRDSQRERGSLKRERPPGERDPSERGTPKRDKSPGETERERFSRKRGPRRGGSKSCFLIVLTCFTRHRILASASANQGPDKGDLIPL